MRPPVHLLQDLSDVGERLPQVVPQAVLQQGQAGVPLRGAHHMDGPGVPQSDGTLQCHVQPLDDAQQGL